MRPKSCLIVAVVLAAVVATVRLDAGEWTITRVLSTNEDVVALLGRGYQRSTTLRRLVDDVERSEWIVFLLAGSCPNRQAVGCLLHTTGTFNGRPYLRIVVQHAGRHPDSVLSTIGHELQHAVEVIDAQTSRDSESIDALFRRIGTKVRAGGGTLYETTAAQRAGEQVLRELQGADRLH